MMVRKVQQNCAEADSGVRTRCGESVYGAPEAGLEPATRCFSRLAPSARDAPKRRIPQTISYHRRAGNLKNGPRNRQQTVNRKMSDEGRPGERILAALPAGRRLRFRVLRTPSLSIRSQPRAARPES
jgi:hypothetical protein